jgi:hypothetical protein
VQRATCSDCGCTFYVEDRWIGFAREESSSKALNCPVGCNLGLDESTIRLEVG